MTPARFLSFGLVTAFASMCLQDLSARLPEGEKPEAPALKAPYRPATEGDADILELRSMDDAFQVRWSPMRSEGDHPRRRTHFIKLGESFGEKDRFKLLAIIGQSARIRDNSNGLVIDLKLRVPKRLPWKPSAMPSIDQVGVEERAAKFTKRSIKNDAKLAGLKLAVSMMDLTTLEGADTAGKVRQLCAKALQPMDERFGCPRCAAVCVYPNLVGVAKGLLDGTGVGIASVATSFPSGQVPLKSRLDEVRFAVREGATEIDMVIARGAFLSGDYARVAREIRAVREACGEAHLKVIFETGEIGAYDKVRLASDIAMRNGAHFIKTSTGKIPIAATLPVSLVMLEAIRDHYYETGEKIGMKPAGGMRTAKEALQYLVMLKETLGDAWLTPELFRFGASSLLTDVTLQIAKREDGRYQNTDYFSMG